MAESISCEPADLAAASKCFDCLDERQARAVELYLLREIAGLGAQTPTQLMAAAAAAKFPGLSPREAEALRLYLTCQAVNTPA